MTESLQNRLIMLQVGGCSCMTKTPDISHHDPMCVYRIAVEAHDALFARKPAAWASNAEMEFLAETENGSASVSPTESAARRANIVDPVPLFRGP